MKERVRERVRERESTPAASKVSTGVVGGGIEQREESERDATGVVATRAHRLFSRLPHPLVVYERVRGGGVERGNKKQLTTKE